MPKISLYAYSSMEQAELQARLVQLIVDCGGWVLEEKTRSVGGYGLRFEVALSEIAEVYSALQQSGILLTSVAHRSLTEMCLCSKHLKRDEAQIVSVHLHVGMMRQEDVRFRRFVLREPV
jgi:hypothetical protein